MSAHQEPDHAAARERALAPLSGALAAPEEMVSPWPAVRRGIAAAAGLRALLLMCAMIGIGGLCRDVGYPLGAGVLSTLLIWAGPGQIVLFTSLASGMALPWIALAVSLSSIRFVPMVMSLLPLLRRPGMRLWHLLGLSHYIAVTAWVEGIRLLPHLPPRERVPFFLGFANTIMLAAALATALGYALVASMPPVLAGALLFSSPLYFTLALTAGATRWLEGLAFVLGFAGLPLATKFAPEGSELIVAGLGMGGLAYAIERARIWRVRCVEKRASEAQP